MTPPPPRELARLGLISGAALILFVFEHLAPRPLPWMKLGLGNVAVVLALLAYGPAAALAVALIKLVVGSLITGSFGGPAFAIGGGAGLASWGAMALVRSLASRRFSPVGLSIIGAAVHQVSQLGIAYLYIRQAGLFALLPLSLASALGTGALIGLLAHWALAKLRANGWLESV